jgi:hypothetical protein
MPSSLSSLAPSADIDTTAPMIGADLVLERKYEKPPMAYYPDIVDTFIISLPLTLY